MSRVLVAVPTRGWIYYKVASALSKLEAQGFPVVMSQSSYGVEAARKRLLKYFIEFDEYSHLMFLDDDIIPPTDIIARLLKHDKDMMSASYNIMQDGELKDSSALWNGKSYDKFSPNGGYPIVSVDACGLGACLMKREMVKDVFRKDCLGIEYDDQGEVTKGEDYKFCEVVKHCGYYIYVDFSIRCEHYKYTPIGKGVL